MWKTFVVAGDLATLAFPLSNWNFAGAAVVTLVWCVQYGRLLRWMEDGS